jgi:17beta-estradiol 17-dehydrogenase / very-long-chain 3-oxoacyl-CoA reductase
MVFISSFFEMETYLNCIIALFSVIGFYKVLTYFYRNIRFFYTQYLRKPLDLKRRYGENTWCVVTGASDGIGLGFAVEFSKLGFNICLISRT